MLNIFFQFLYFHDCRKTDAYRLSEEQILVAE